MLPRGHTSRLSHARHSQHLGVGEVVAEAGARLTHLSLVPLKQIKRKPAYVAEIYRHQGSLF